MLHNTKAENAEEIWQGCQLQRLVLFRHALSIRENGVEKFYATGASRIQDAV